MKYVAKWWKRSGRQVGQSFLFLFLRKADPYWQWGAGARGGGLTNAFLSAAAGGLGLDWLYASQNWYQCMDANVDESCKHTWRSSVNTQVVTQRFIFSVIRSWSSMKKREGHEPDSAQANQPLHWDWRDVRSLATPSTRLKKDGISKIGFLSMLSKYIG